MVPPYSSLKGAQVPCAPTSRMAALGFSNEHLPSVLLSVFFLSSAWLDFCALGDRVRRMILFSFDLLSPASYLTAACSPGTGGFWKTETRKTSMVTLSGAGTLWLSQTWGCEWLSECGSGEPEHPAGQTMVPRTAGPEDTCSPLGSISPLREENQGQKGRK